MAAIDLKTLQGKLKGKVGNTLTAQDVQGILDCLEGIVARISSLDNFAQGANIHTHNFWMGQGQGQPFLNVGVQALPLLRPNPAKASPAPTAPALTLIPPNQNTTGATIRLSRPVPG